MIRQSFFARFVVALSALLALSGLLGVEYAAAQKGPITVYSGRNQPLVEALFADFTAATGIEVQVRYADTTELAVTILEEGNRSPADVFFAQDGGALGALAHAGRLIELPEELLERVPASLRSPDGHWVGTSGRARVIAYNVNNVAEEELPASIWDLTDPKWAGRIGWAPTNASFQAFVTALRHLESEEAAEAWLRAMRQNGARTYHNNVAIYNALGRGEIDLGITNHYYLFRFFAEEGEGFPVRLHFTDADAGSMVNVAGVGVLRSSDKQEEALALVEYLLSEPAQLHFVNANYEYPVISGVEAHPLLRPFNEIAQPEIDLSDLKDLEGSLALLLRAGII